MRHVWSLITGLVAAPLAWLLLAAGQNASSEKIAGWVATNGYDTHHLIEPAAYLVVAAVLLGVLGTLRISPLGPLVAGLLLIAAYVATFINPLAVHREIPNDWALLERPIPLHVPLDNGTLAVLGVLLLVAPFSVQRWRRWPSTAAAPVAPETAPETPQPEAEAVVAPPKPPAPPLTPASVAVPGPPVESPARRKAAAPVQVPASLAGATSALDGPDELPQRPRPSRATASSPSPTPSPSPAPAPAPDKPGPGGPAPTDPSAPRPVPDEPETSPVPAARRPSTGESPWAEPPSGSSRKTKTPG